MIIFYSYICFRRAVVAQQGSTAVLPFRTPFHLQPYMAWFGMCFCGVILFFNGFYIFWPGAFTASGFVSDYFGVFMFIVTYGGWKLWKRPHHVKASEADIWGGKREIDDEEAEFVEHEAERPRRWYDRYLDILF